MSKKIITRLTLLLLTISSANVSIAADNYFCWNYEVSETGVKGSRGYGYQSSGAPTHSGESGTFDTVIYNVDGFPKCLGGNSNSRFKSLLNRLNADNFNIVLMQEMFTAKKHSFLRDESRLTKSAYPYRSRHFRGNMISYGDGLLRLSDFPFDMDNRDDDDYTLSTFEAEYYDDCSSEDCWTEKGFTVAIHEITDQFKVHVYNTHMDAGSESDDVDAKRNQFMQLADFINAYSNGAAVIVGGDFNAKWDDNRAEDEYLQIWNTFMAMTGLRMACQDLISGADDSLPQCAYQYRADTDQILYRDSDQAYQLELTGYEILDYDELSDHEPNRAVFRWFKK